MCFLRVFGVFMFTMVMLFRLDFDVYMRGLEGWDFGVFVCVCMYVYTYGVCTMACMYMCMHMYMCECLSLNVINDLQIHV